MEVSGQFHASDALLPGKEPYTHWMGRWVGPRASQDAMMMKKIPAPAENRTPIFQPVASRYTEWATPAHSITT
jgi:hypothetical protein